MHVPWGIGRLGDPPLPTRGLRCGRNFYEPRRRDAFAAARLSEPTGRRRAQMLRRKTRLMEGEARDEGASTVAPTVAAHGTSGRVRRGARGLGLPPAPCAAAPVVFAAIRAAMLRRRDTVSSPCDVSHRASDEPRRRMSLSSALAPSSLASPSIRRVFLRSFCARRRPVSSLNLARVSPGAKRSRRRRAQCGVQIRRDFVRTIIAFHHFPALLRTDFW